MSLAKPLAPEARGERAVSVTANPVQEVPPASLKVKPQGDPARPWLFLLGFSLFTLVAVAWLILGILPALYFNGVISLHLLRPFVTWIDEATPWPITMGALVYAGYNSQPLAFVAYQYLFSLLNLGMAWVLIALRPRDWVARLFALGMVGTAAIFNLESHTVTTFGGPPAQLLHDGLHAVAGGIYLLALVLFPHGKFPALPLGRWSVPKEITIPAQVLIGLLIVLFGMGAIFDGEPEAYVLWYGLIAPIFGLTAQGLRYWQAQVPEERHLCQIFMWTLGLALALTAVIGVASWLISTPALRLSARWQTQTIFFAFPLLYTMLPLSLTWLVLRYRLWRLEFLINQSLLYGALTTIVGGLYVVSVGLLNRWLENNSGMSLTLVAGVIAVLAVPLCYGRVQRLVNRLMPPAQPPMTTTILRHRLWDVHALWRQLLVYTALTATTLLLYMVLVQGLSRLLVLAEGGNWLLSILATGLIAILFHPLRLWLQRVVNRLLYGQRDEPAKVLSHLGARLAATMTPEDTLLTVVQTISTALKLPYAALFMPRGGRLRKVASVGEPPAMVETIPVHFHGESLGELRVSSRRPQGALTPGDQRLLVEVANQAGAALHAVQLMVDLQRSREQLVTAQEEERRRLRRDLHDDLGPQLATLSLKIDAARNLLRRDPDHAERLLIEYKTQTQGALADLRRIVDDLRPPALDQLGLLAALQQHLTSYAAHSAVHFALEAPDWLPPLPAAVEVAAYRIVLEAVTNVMRHAQARRCTVRLALNRETEQFEIEIADDGVGIVDGHRAGVGILSMCERAAELGGQCTVRCNEAGTFVHAVLPMLSAGQGT